MAYVVLDADQLAVDWVPLASSISPKIGITFTVVVLCAEVSSQEQKFTGLKLRLKERIEIIRSKAKVKKVKMLRKIVHKVMFWALWFDMI